MPGVFRHTPEQAGQELNLIVDHGGRVKNISISHRVYGRITAEMDIRSRQDVQEFLQAAGGASICFPPQRKMLDKTSSTAWLLIGIRMRISWLIVSWEKEL